MTTETFNNIFLEFKDRAMRKAWSIVGNRNDAEDIVQDVYEKLWRRRLLIRQAEFHGLLMTAVRNASIDLTRRRRPTTPPIDNSQSAPQSDHALLDELFRAISQLPEVQQEIVTMHDIEGMTTQEIAHITGHSPEAIRMALHRARTTLKKKLTKIMSHGVE